MRLIGILVADLFISAAPALPVFTARPAGRPDRRRRLWPNPARRPRSPARRQGVPRGDQPQRWGAERGHVGPAQRRDRVVGRSLLHRRLQYGPRLVSDGHRWTKSTPAAAAVGERRDGSGTINGGYAADSRTLLAFANGRGVGDCGTTQTWTWTGNTFVLSAEREMQECWGMPADLWPTTWRTRER